MESEIFRHLLEAYGAVGMVLAMFLESSVIPFPSEAVVAAAAYFGIPLRTIVWAGTLGSTLGGCVGYAIGRLGVRWCLARYGRWIGATSARLAKMDALAVRYGVWSVLIGRLLPLVPFKVFSIGAGMARIPFGGFVVMTLIGVIPRLILLALAGEWLRRATGPTLIILSAAGLGAYVIRRWRSKRPLSA